jgi:hypothetical protein
VFLLQNTYRIHKYKFELQTTDDIKLNELAYILLTEKN